MITSPDSTVQGWEDGPTTTNHESTKMKYKVREVYTPDDTDLDRKRQDAEFESDSTDLFELAIQARTACHQPYARTEATITNIRKHLEHYDILVQLEGQDPTCFDFMMWSNNGEWEITVERVEAEEAEEEEEAQS